MSERVEKVKQWLAARPGLDAAAAHAELSAAEFRPWDTPLTFATATARLGTERFAAFYRWLKQVIAADGPIGDQAEILVESLRAGTMPSGTPETRACMALVANLANLPLPPDGQPRPGGLTADEADRLCGEQPFPLGFEPTELEVSQALADLREEAERGRRLQQAASIAAWAMAKLGEWQTAVASGSGPVDARTCAAFLAVEADA